MHESVLLGELVVSMLFEGVGRTVDETLDVEDLRQQLPLVVAILIGSYLLARAVHWYGKRTLKRENEAEGTLRAAILEEVYRPIAITIALVGIYTSLVVLERIEEGATIEAGLSTVLIVVWAWTGIRIGNRWIAHVRASDSGYEFAPVFKNLWTVAIVVGSVLLLLSIWEIEITPFLASAGLLGVIVGLAAQDGIANLIGGVALYVDNTYKVGDVILVEDDMRGTVTDIGVRSTTVLTSDNRVISVPNAVLNSNQVVNETAPQRHVRLEFPFSVAYGTDPELVEDVLLEACEEANLIREQPSPHVLFLSFGDSSLEFIVRAYISHPLSEKRARDQLNRLAVAGFEEAGVDVPFPQRTLSFAEDATSDDRSDVPGVAARETDEETLDSTTE